MNNKITNSDILSVAQSLSIRLSDEEVRIILKDYNIEENNDPTATWDLIVENLIYRQKNNE